jgi:serine/threonine-protein kinase
MPDPLRAKKQAVTVVQSPDPKVVGSLLSPFANGSTIAGKYLIEHRIAEGGIGVVLAAQHLVLQKRVAVKYLRPEVLGNSSLVERFIREARLAASITSEHVVRIHDVSMLEEAGPYIVMEHLVGNDLSRAIQKGPLPIAAAVDYVLQACDALAEAHARGIVHRDIKPENLFLAVRPSNTPILKVIDFGIAKTAPERSPVGQFGREACRTSTNERFGTLLYMSPEQLRSTSDVDKRSDIWSIGIVLHELLTSSLPFSGDGTPQLCTSILTGAPTPLTVARPDAPPGLEAVVLNCLEKDPDRRYRNVAELAQELLPFGPPNAAAMVDRIKAVVLDGGSSIRPPSPVAGSVAGQPKPVSQVGLSPRDSRSAITVTIARRRHVSISRTAAVIGAATAAAFIGTVVAIAMGRGSEAKADGNREPPRIVNAAAVPPVESTAAPRASATGWNGWSVTVVPAGSASTLTPSGTIGSIVPPTPASTVVVTTVATVVAPMRKRGPTPAATVAAPASDPRAAFGDRK